MIFGYSWKTIFCTKHETNGRILIWIQVSVLDPDLQHCFYHSTFLFCSEEGKFDFLLNDHNDYGVHISTVPTSCHFIEENNLFMRSVTLGDLE